MSDDDDLKRPPILLGRPFSAAQAAAFRRLGYDVRHTDEPAIESDVQRLLIASPEAAKGYRGSSMQIKGDYGLEEQMNALARILKTVFMNDQGQMYVYDDGEPIVVPSLDPPPPRPVTRAKAAKRRRPLS